MFLGLNSVNRIEWTDDQTVRRFAECTVQDVDLDDLVREEEVVEEKVPLVVAQVPVAVSASMRTWRGQTKMTLQSENGAVTQSNHFEPKKHA